jgi:hypothetical protein
MFTCSVCSKRSALHYDDKTKLYFCEVHNNSDLIIKEEPKKKPSKKMKIYTGEKVSKAVKNTIKKIFTKK